MPPAADLPDHHAGRRDQAVVSGLDLLEGLGLLRSLISRATTSPTGSGSVWIRLTLTLTGKALLRCPSKEYPSREWKEPRSGSEPGSSPRDRRPPAREEEVIQAHRASVVFLRPVSRCAAGLRSTISRSRDRTERTRRWLRERPRPISKWRLAGFMSRMGPASRESLTGLATNRQSARPTEASRMGGEPARLLSP